MNVRIAFVHDLTRREMAIPVFVGKILGREAHEEMSKDPPCVPRM
jgi:hypothetical protein